MSRAHLEEVLARIAAKEAHIAALERELKALNAALGWSQPALDSEPLVTVPLAPDPLLAADVASVVAVPVAGQPAVPVRPSGPVARKTYPTEKHSRARRH